MNELRNDPLMAHLLDELDAGRSIGHYGRLVFTMVARHFMDEDELVAWLSKDPDADRAHAGALVRQVAEHGYSPPTREKILEFQAHQTTRILPDARDPDVGNVYKTLRFPPDVYEHIEEYYEEKVAAEPDR